MRLQLGMYLLCCVAWAGSAAAEPAAVNVFRNDTEGYNNFRIPAIIRTAEGTLLAFCEARAGGDAAETDLVLRRSTDQGKSWGPVEVVQESDDFASLFRGEVPPITVGNPAPVVDLLHPQHPGRIWLPFTLENDRVFVTFSDDDGKTWTKPREITSAVKRDGWGWYATGPCHAIQLQQGPQRGRLVVPADHRLGAGGSDRGPCGIQVIYSDDHGETWKLGAVDDTYEDGLEANETCVAELGDGRLYFNTRDQNGPAPGTRGEAYSNDGGETFVSAGEKYRWVQPAPEVLDPPVVECSVLAVPLGGSQEVLLFSGPDENGPSGKGRSDLRIRFSRDGGRSWKDGPLLHEGPAAYSDMVLLDEEGGRVGILFEAGERGGKAYNRIDFLTFSVRELSGE